MNILWYVACTKTKLVAVDLKNTKGQKGKKADKSRIKSS